MSVKSFSVEDVERAREALHRGEMSVTLVAKEGEPIRLGDLGTLCTGLNRLLSAVQKEVEPTARIEWRVSGIGLVDERLKVTVGGFTPWRKRRSGMSKRAVNEPPKP